MVLALLDTTLVGGFGFVVGESAQESRCEASRQVLASTAEIEEKKDTKSGRNEKPLTSVGSYPHIIR